MSLPTPPSPLGDGDASAHPQKPPKRPQPPQPPQPFQLPQPAKPSNAEPPFNPSSWSGALIVMAFIAGVIWIIQIVNASDSYGLDRFGLKPRAVSGLWGVVTMPFLHGSYHHLVSNTLPLVIIGWVLLLSGLRVWAAVTAIVVIGGGFLTWLVAPSGDIVGASGMIFGWLGYLLARAYFTRKLRWIIVAVLVLAFFGTLLFGLLPSVSTGVSWQAHLCGFVAGIGAGALLHPRSGEARQPRRPAVS